MKIQQLNFATISNVPINNKNRQRDISYNRNYESISNIYYQPVGINSTKAYKTVLFRGHKVHIIDGGIHAKHMKHFAKFVRADFDLSMHDVAINSKDKNIKQLESIYSQLVKLNSTKIEKGEYVAIPALASVPLLNIKDQYEKIMGESEYFTPENIKSKKEKLIKFLKKIYEDASYKTYVRYMDPVEQGFEYVYPIIQEVNKLVSKGVGVYIPSGHPIDGSLKWLAKEKKQDVELYHYIATGEDINNSVKKMVDEIKRLNWYSFNLLTLSDANIIGLKDKSWNKDYIYSAFDSCVTESARGVYNLSPVRSVGRVIGYSFSDKLLNDYPYDEFPLNDQVSNILKYVGKDKSEMLATEADIRRFKEVVRRSEPKANMPDKLYPIQRVLTSDYIKNFKLELQGHYIDRTLKLLFDLNENNKFYFKKCDCEGSGRPSVLSVWGSCYALFNAISSNIELMKNADTAEEDMKSEMRKAFSSKYLNDTVQEEVHLNNAIKCEKILAKAKNNSPTRIEPYVMLAEIYSERGDYDNALGCLNYALDELVSIYTRTFYVFSRNAEIADLYYKIADICEMKGETYPAKVCRAAAYDIEHRTGAVTEIMRRRNENIHYIGDLYSEIKP